MAQITGQAGVNLTQELANYLDASGGNLTSEQLSTIINQYLSGYDKLEKIGGGSISNGIYKRFGEFDQVNGKIQVVTTGSLEWRYWSINFILYFICTRVKFKLLCKCL